MRSSCWKEWDSKVVFSDKPSSSDSGKKLLNGANANCNFCTEGGRGQGGEKRENWTITHLVNKNQCSQTTLLTAHLHLPSLLALINTGSHLIKAVQFQKPILRVWHFKESEKATWIFISYHITRTSGAPGEPGWEVLGWGWVGGLLFMFETCVYLFQELDPVPQALHLLRHVLSRVEPSTCREPDKYRNIHQR